MPEAEQPLDLIALSEAAAAANERYVQDSIEMDKAWLSGDMDRWERWLNSFCVRERGYVGDDSGSSISGTTASS